MRPWVENHIRHAFSLGLTEEGSILAYLETASIYGTKFADRGDVLILLIDDAFLEDWDYTRSVFDAQHREEERAHIASPHNQSAHKVPTEPAP